MFPFPSTLLIATGSSGSNWSIGLASMGAVPITSPVQYSTEVVDTENYVDIAGNPTRLTLQNAGLYRCAFASNNSATLIFTGTKNGSEYDGAFKANSNTSGGDPTCGTSGIIPCSAADYFEMLSSGSSTPAATGNWFGVEKLDPTTKYAFATRITSNQAMASNTTIDCVFNNEIVDTSGFYDPTTGLITVPSGVSRIRITTNIETASATNGAAVFIAKGDGTFRRGLGGSAEGNFTFNKYLNAVSAVLDVTAGDTFKIQAIAGSATSLVASHHTWVCVEEVPNYTRVLAYRAASLSIPSGSTTKVALDSTVYGSSMLNTTDGAVVVPSGVSYGRFSFGYDGPDSGTNIAWVAKNADALRYPGLPHDICAGFFNTASGLGIWAPVTPGEEYALEMFNSVGGTTLSDSNLTWLCAEFR